MQARTFGHDSEFGIKQGSMILSALDVYDDNVYEDEKGRYFADNMNVEIAINPVTTLKDWHGHTEHLLGKVRDQGYDLVMEPVIVYPDEALKHPTARISGCNPDYSPYFLRNNLAPDFADMDGTRSCGAHVHAELRGEMVNWWARWMDIHVTLGLLAREKKSSRRSLYGQAGCLREKPYGGEYRALSNVWLDDPALREYVWEGSHKAIESAKIDPNTIDNWDEIPTAIDTHDIELAQRCLDRLYVYGVAKL